MRRVELHVVILLAIALSASSCGTKVSDLTASCSNTVTYSSEPYIEHDQPVDVGGGIAFTLPFREEMKISGVKLKASTSATTTIAIRVFKAYVGTRPQAGPWPEYEMTKVLPNTGNIPSVYHIDFPQAYTADALTDESRIWAVGVVVTAGAMRIYDGYVEEPAPPVVYGYSYNGAGGWYPMGDSNAVVAGAKISKLCQ